MSSENDLIRGAVKLDTFIEDKCFTSWKEFIAALPGMLTVEIPASITNVNVGNQQPSDSERDNLWIRKDNAGSFLGIYLYASGSWKKIYPVPGEFNIIFGDSRTPPDGYTLTDDLSSLTSSQKAVLRKVWHVGGTSPSTWYDIFTVQYTGF